MFEYTPEKAKELIEEYLGNHSLGSIEKELDLFLVFLVKKDLSNKECQYVISVWDNEVCPKDFRGLPEC